MSKYQIALYNTDGEVPDADEIIWEAETDTEAIGHARTVMADWPEWIGSLNRWHEAGGRRRGGVWVADIHEAGCRVDTTTDGFDAAVNGAAS